MSIKKEWSIKQIQDMVVDSDEWGEKKTIYATDADKCQSGVYLALKGEKPTNPIDPESLRRMGVGELVEKNQIKKLEALGILIKTGTGEQHRVFSKEFNVSGRLDALIISPEHCSAKAKKIIARKVDLYKELKEVRKNLYKGISKFEKGEIDEETVLKGKMDITRIEHEIYKEIGNHDLELLKPDPKNHLMIVEIKSISEWGFKYREKENSPMESHQKQAMFYLSELRKVYPNICARVLYVQMPYQDLLEFDVPFDEKIMDDLRKNWTKLNNCLKKNEMPTPVENVILNDKTGKWQVNYQAEWCRYHDKCTGDPNWFQKAKDTVLSLNSKPKVDEPKKVTRKTTKKK